MFYLSDYAEEIYKARQYVLEPWRVLRCTEGWMFRGNNTWHFITVVDGVLHCDCRAFRRKLPILKFCPHTMTLERLGIHIQSVAESNGLAIVPLRVFAE